MENERDTQNNTIDIPCQPAKNDAPVDNTPVESDSRSSEPSSNGQTNGEQSSGRRSSSSGHSGGSSHSSSSHSGSSNRSGSSSHSGSSSRSGSSGHSSSSGHSGSRGHTSSGKRSSSSKHSSRSHKHDDREIIPLEKRLKTLQYTIKSNLYKYKPKYLYRKYKRRFKKASMQKKIGYVILLVSFFAVIGLFTKFVVVDNFTPDGDTVTIPKTTRAPIPAKPIGPKVEVGYDLKDTGKINDFETGFIVSLPEINSDKAVAEQINAEINALKEEMRTKYATSGNLNAYPEKYDYSYSTFSNDAIVFISIYKSYETPDKEPAISNIYYVYDFINDSLISEYKLPELFLKSDIEMLTIINEKLDAIGATQIESMAGIALFVNKKGRLSANVSIDDGSGGKASVLVEMA